VVELFLIVFAGTELERAQSIGIFESQDKAVEWWQQSEYYGWDYFVARIND
jgi:hypothetical protein